MSQVERLRAAIAKLERLKAESTPGPWIRGDVWHIQGASMCQCREDYGPLVREQRMSINGTMMQAHVHRREKPWHQPVITTEPWDDGHPRYPVITTDEYGAIRRPDAELIVTLHRTIDVQLAILRTALDSGVNLGGDLDESYWQELALADAILGGAS